ncbi:MAG: chorismate-binding protein [Spirosomataceae bacterium]|jgi:isochorismate synthase|nr:chorismate-binding protein [Flectobacillus sp.]
MTPYLENHVSVKHQTVDVLWHGAVTEGHPVALWRLPRTTEKQLLIDLSCNVSTRKIDLEELPSGFAISPFEGESLFLKADLYYCFSADLEEQASVYSSTYEAEIFEKKCLEHWDEKQFFTQELSPIVATEKKKFTYPSFPSLYDEEVFGDMVKQAVAQIEQGKMQKVVLSRTKEISLPENFELIEAFNKLCVAYPDAFVSVVYLPETKEIWMGATPETLISVDKEGIFKTMSLAGTQSALDEKGDFIAPVDIRWSHKEIEEQAFVSRYIIGCFKKIRLREYHESGPKTVMAGNLMHLRSDFKVDVNEVNFPQLGTVMTELLHPTSAVCGMPKKPAIDFIAGNEMHDREFYSGFLGPVNINQETSLFVNLRTMKIQGNDATLFAGCGITTDSDPVKEWKETEMKCQTLLRVIL